MGETALHIACCSNREKVIRFLVESGADCKLKNRSGKTPIDVLRTRNQPLAKWIKEHERKAVHDAHIKMGEQLVEAATGGDVDTIRSLFLQGVHVDTRNSEGSCALRRASRLGHTKLVHALLTEFGANINARNAHNGETALHFACKFNREETIRVLIAS